MSLIWARSIQSMPHPTSWRSILILSSHLRLGLPSPLSLTLPHQNPVCTSPLYHTRYLSHPSYFSWFDHSNNIWWGVQIIKFLLTYFSPLPCYLVPHRTKYPPLHLILKYPQPMFFPQCERPNFTPIQNRQNYKFHTNNKCTNCVSFILK